MSALDKATSIRERLLSNVDRMELGNKAWFFPLATRVTAEQTLAKHANGSCVKNRGKTFFFFFIYFSIFLVFWFVHLRNLVATLCR